MATLAFDVRRFFHRFALHAAILSLHSYARTVRMSALLCILTCHLSSPRPDSPAEFPSGPALSKQLLAWIPSPRKHTRPSHPSLFKMAHPAHSPTSWVRTGNPLLLFSVVSAPSALCVKIPSLRLRPSSPCTAQSPSEHFPRAIAGVALGPTAIVPWFLNFRREIGQPGSYFSAGIQPESPPRGFKPPVNHDI